MHSTDLEASYALWQKAQWDGATGVTQEGDVPWVWLVNVDHLYWVRDGLAGRGTENPSPRPRLVHCQQCGPVELGVRMWGNARFDFEREGQL